jgi:hypothetical protein
MSDLAHVPGQRLQLASGRCLDDVFSSALKHGGGHAEPAAARPRGDGRVRSAHELEAVITQANIRYEACNQLSISLAWWNGTSDDPDWQLSEKPTPALVST